MSPSGWASAAFQHLGLISARSLQAQIPLPLAHGADTAPAGASRLHGVWF